MEDREKEVEQEAPVVDHDPRPQGAATVVDLEAPEDIFESSDEQV